MRYLTFVLVLFISACASAPSNYYSLDQSDNVKAINKNKISGVQLTIGQIPQQYDRPQLLVLDESIAPRVYVLNDSLWASPLGDQIQRTLSNDVAHYLGVPDVKGVAGLKDVKRIIVRIVNFDMILNKGAYIQANWSDTLNDSEPQLCKASIVVDNPAKDVAELVNSQKYALRALAALIALQDQINSTEISKKIVSYDLGCT